MSSDNFETRLEKSKKRVWKHIGDTVLFRKQREIQSSEKKAKEFMPDYETPNPNLSRNYLEQRGWELEVNFVWSSGRYDMFKDYSNPESVDECGYMFRKENKLLRFNESCISIQDYMSRNFLYSGECENQESFEKIVGALETLRK